ncbi:AbgT family transporter, partial [Rodentibacter caecimuris]
MSSTISQKNSRIQHFLKGVEWLGNLLPHPIILFMLMCGILIVLSAVLHYF